MQENQSVNGINNKLENTSGSVEYDSNKVTIYHKSLKKLQEINFTELDKICIQKATFTQGYIRFILKDSIIEKEKYYYEWSDECTLLFDKAEEEKFINFAKEISDISGKEYIILTPKPVLKVISEVLYGIMIFILFLLGLISLFVQWQLGLFFIVLGFTLISGIKFFINNKLYKWFKMNDKNKRIVKFSVGLLKFIFFTIMFILVANNMPAPETKTSPAQSVQTEQQEEVSTESSYRNNKNAKLIAEETGLDKDQAGNVYEVLVNCGVDKVRNIKLFSENEDYANSYDIEADDFPSKIIIYIDDKGNVPEMYYDMNTIVKDGKKVANVTDYVLTYEEWLNLRVQAQTYIKNFLVAPKTAKYEKQGYSIGENKIITVSGVVEVKNLYGVPLQYVYSLQYKKTNSGFDYIKGKLGDEDI